MVPQVLFFHIACLWLQGCELEVETHEIYSFFSNMCGYFEKIMQIFTDS